MRKKKTKKKHENVPFSNPFSAGWTKRFICNVNSDFLVLNSLFSNLKIQFPTIVLIKIS